MTERAVMLWGGLGEDLGGWGTPDLHENVSPALFAAIFMRYSDASFTKRFRTRKFATRVSWRGIVIANSADMLAIEKPHALSWRPSVAEHQAKTEVPKKACHS
jgi:hypothetical protein